MQPLFSHELANGVAHIAHTTKSDGDLSPSNVDLATLTARRASIIDRPWRTVVQVHGDRVITADHRCIDDPRPTADALISASTKVALAVHSGDCVPVGFVSAAGAIGVAHAGWKGLELGVLESVVRSLRSLSTAPVVAVVGPHIRASRYEFGDQELRRLARRLGPAVMGTTQRGTSALDLTAGISSELDRLGVGVAAASPDCTGELQDDYWSHRQRGESGRIALVAWIEAA